MRIPTSLCTFVCLFNFFPFRWFKSCKNFARTVQFMAFNIGSTGNATGLNGASLFPIIYYLNSNSIRSHLIQISINSFRVLWIIAFVTSFLACVGLIYSMWLKWDDHPVLMSLNRERLPISVVPFPAMTICPLAKSRADIFDYTNVYRRMTKLDGNKTRVSNETEYKMN